MKIVKISGLVLLSLFLLIVIVSFVLPSKVHVERSIGINAQTEKVFTLVNDLKRWREWSPWHKRDTAMQITYTENPEGEGTSYSWKSEQVGEGTLTITQSKPYDLIATEMNFGDMGVSKGTFKFESTDSGTKVTWSMNSDGSGVSWLMYVPSKYMNLFMDDMLGSDFEEGLKNLKEATESIPQQETIAGFKADEKTLDAMMILSIRETVKNAEIGTRSGEILTQIGDYLNKTGRKENGHPFTIWHRTGAEESEIEVGVPVDTIISNYKKILFSELSATNALVISYYGPYESTGPVYEAAFSYLENKGKKSGAPPHEVYMTDPSTEPDANKWLTEIIFPVE